MRYRKLDVDRDMQFGGGASDFWKDQPEAVAQAVETRLGLWLGQWFLDTSAGVPYETEVLGKYTESTRDPTLRDHILSTTGVVAIEKYASQHDRDARAFSVQATISTAYGQAQIRGPK